MEEKNCKCMDKKIVNETKAILNQYKQDKDNLVQVLNEVQDKFGYIPEKAQAEISEYLHIPMAEIYGVITFYSRFTLKPKGKYSISICMGTACFVKGSEKILERAKEKLGIRRRRNYKEWQIFYRYN